MKRRESRSIFDEAVNEHDTDMRPTRLIVPGVEAMTYGYDAADRMTALNDGSFNPTMQQTLGYDQLNRLSSVSSPANTESWQYDADGNAISRTLNGTTSQVYPSASSSRLDHTITGGSTVSYGYDAKGNLISSTWGPGLNYDPFNRMNLSTAALSTSYYVNPEGQRLRKSNSSNTTWFAPDAGGALEADDSNGVWSDYVWLNGRPIALIRGGTTYAIHDDHLGRPQAVTNPVSSTVWVTENYPYRRKVMTDLIGGLNLGYPGQYQDSETGYWNNGARDYDQGAERYIESDPIGLLGGVNTYAYVGNNPISGIDPLGLCDQQKCSAAQAAVAALGQQLSSYGRDFTWGGIAAVGISGLALIGAPEGAPLELDGLAGGAAAIEFGGGASTLGSTLTGYAHGGALGAAKGFGASFVLGKINQFAAGLGASSGVSGPNIQAVQGLLDQSSDAILEEQAACGN